MKLYGIDPGTKQSAIVMLEMDGPNIKNLEMDLKPNRCVENILVWEPGDHMIYEWIQNYGRVVGQEVLMTAYWCGRFASAADSRGMKVTKAMRPEVVRHFTGQTNVKKAHVRQAVLDRFGGSQAKRKGNILYGVSNHMWDALALAMFMLEDTDVCKPDSWQQDRDTT